MRCALPLSLLALLCFACASSERRLEDVWSEFERSYESTSAHEERVRTAVVEHARTSGDEQALVAWTIPPCPQSCLFQASTLASVAYLAASSDGITRALAVVREIEEQVTTAERQLHR